MPFTNLMAHRLRASPPLSPSMRGFIPTHSTLDSHVLSCVYWVKVRWWRCWRCCLPIAVSRSLGWKFVPSSRWHLVISSVFLSKASSPGWWTLRVTPVMDERITQERRYTGRNNHHTHYYMKTSDAAQVDRITGLMWSTGRLHHMWPM